LIFYAETILPATDKKIKIIRTMEAEHQKMSTAIEGVLCDPYNKMTLGIKAMLDRATFQYQFHSDWLEDPAKPLPDSSQVDNTERSALDIALFSLNDLIFKKVVLTPEAWVKIKLDDFNSVRSSIGLGPLSLQTFESINSLGMKGVPVHFFS
jgi:hypothetical protein